MKTTQWTLIERAASGEDDARNRFAQLYAPAVAAYLRRRWQGGTFIELVDDTVQDIFVECFQDDGILTRADRDRGGKFRSYFYGAARIAALRVEEEARRNVARGLAPQRLHHAEAVADDHALSEVFDRAWAQSVVREAIELHQTQAELFGGREQKWVEILRLRFEGGKPVRDIAPIMGLSPERAHQEFRAAKKAFRGVLERVVATHYDIDGIGLEERCREVLGLLG